MSTLRSSAAKNPLLMPMKTGHRLAEACPTVPTVTVSAAPAGAGRNAAPRSAVALWTRDLRVCMLSSPLFCGHIRLYRSLRDVMPCDFAAGGKPHALVPADVVERRIESADAVRHAGQIRMDGNRHHASGFRTLAIKHVELPADHVLELRRGA